MVGLILSCRPGFEKDAGVEIQNLAVKHNCFGYFRFDKNAGWLVFESYDPSQYDMLLQTLSFRSFIFVRQWFLATGECPELDVKDRISGMLEDLEALPAADELRVEHPESDDGKELSKFCRKFTVPLRQVLKAKSVYQSKSTGKVLFAFFVSTHHCFIGYAYKKNCSDLPLGIRRLKFPHEAPSRSTLKLEEAFLEFIPEAQRDDRIQGGMHAVDLGACPGGWTYQLVQRGMQVQAIDNGDMADVVMDTGLVKHYKEDGFVYEPKRKNVTWLVCDMIEKPQRVAALMSDWVVKGWCKEAIFNLKLPMKKRYESVQECIDVIHETMLKNGVKKYECLVKHLYHDREEVTVLLRALSQKGSR